MSAGYTTIYKKVLNNCIFEAELDEFLRRELTAEGYSGVTVQMTPTKTDVIIKCAFTDEVHGERDFRLNQLESAIRQRWGFPANKLFVWPEKILARGLSPEIMVENLRAKLEEAMPVRRAAGGILRQAMRSGATGAEVIISGKLRAQRAKAQKFRDGYIVSAGNPGQVFVAKATRHIKMRQGVIGITVRIYNPNVKGAVLPDQITVFSKED